MNPTVPITAIVTAMRRVDATLATLTRIMACDPQAGEVLVHVDGGQHHCALAIREAFPNLSVLESEGTCGPGGSRNKLVVAARHDVVASFDDDSYPYDRDYFARASVLSQQFPKAAIIAAQIIHPGTVVPDDAMVVTDATGFGAGGVVLRKRAFMAAGGFVPVPIAYGMEEEDLSLRFCALGFEQFSSPWLRVYHDSDLTHHARPEVTAASIANIALLAWLRYPVRFWPYGMLQIANRALWCLRNGRRRGVARGLASIPMTTWRFRTYRKSVPAEAVRARRARRTEISQNAVALNPAITRAHDAGQMLA